MTAARPPRAVLDSDVIFSRVLYELFGRAALEERLLTLVWNDELLDEAKRALIERKPLPEPVADRWVRYLSDAFPDQRVEGGVPTGLELSELTRDPRDEHVCALAIGGGADYLLTLDRGYLQDPLKGHGVHVSAPDAFLATAFEQEADAFVRILERQARTWGGGRPLPELLDAIQRARAPVFAANVRAMLAG
jgi:predicted nucleic acid-binding protein